MAGFNGLLDATFLPPRNWTLDKDLTFTSDTIKNYEITMLRNCNILISDEGTITVPAGYITDLASVPRPIWAVISPFDVARAAVIHDLLYEYINTQYKTVNSSAAAEDGPAGRRRGLPAPEPQHSAPVRLARAPGPRLAVTLRRRRATGRVSWSRMVRI